MSGYHPKFAYSIRVSNIVESLNVIKKIFLHYLSVSRVKNPRITQSLELRMDNLIDNKFSSDDARLHEIYSSLAASAAICPAREVTKVFRLVIDDNEQKLPQLTAVRGEAITEAVV